MRILDSLLNNQFEHIVRLFSPQFDYKTQSSAEFVKTFFNKIPAVGGMAVLSKFENDVKVNENMFITYCINQTYFGFCGYSTYVPLIRQSSNYLKAGDNLEITAGIGSFSVECRPEFTIDGKVNQVDENGIVNYKFKTPSKAGEYIKIVTTKAEYISKMSTHEIEALLPSNGFKRIHRSFIISVSKIESYTAEMVEVNGVILPIGRGYRDSIENL